jgi:hypothetical protein
MVRRVEVKEKMRRSLLWLSLIALALALGCETRASDTASADSETAAPVAVADGKLQPPQPRVPQARPTQKTPVPRPGQRDPRFPRTPAPTAKPPEGPQPRIVFDNKKYDFKTAVYGETVTHKYKFTNKGEADLVIERVQPSCGCMAAPLAKKVYPPGASGIIEAKFDTTKKSPSFHRLTVAVYSNDWYEKDRNTYVSVLEMSGDVIVFFRSLPMQYIFNGVARGAPSAGTVTLYSTGETGETLDIDRVEVSNEATMKVDVVKPSPRAGTGNFGPDAVDLNLTYTPPRIGPINERITVLTKSQKQPKMVINVRGTVTGDITVDRRIIYVSNHIKGRPLATNKFRITRRPPDPLKILKIEATPGLLAAPKPFTKDRVFEIHLSLDPKLPPRPYGGVVRVYVNSADQPVVEVPVVVYMKPSVTATPDAFYFEKKPGEPAFVSLVTVRGPPGFPLAVTVDEKSSEIFTAELREPKNPGQPYHVVLRGKADLPAGSIQEKVILKTNVPGEEEIVIPINAEILAQ